MPVVSIGVYLIGGGRHDAEVEAGPAHAPEEVRVLSGGGGDEVARARDHADGFEGVDLQAVKAAIGAYSAAEGGAYHADAGAGADFCVRRGEVSGTKEPR